MLGSVHCDAKISVLFSYFLHSWKGMLSKETKLRISKALGQGPKPVSDMVGLCPILNYSLTRLSNLVWPWWLLATLPCESSTLAWKIPRMEEPGGLQSMRSWRVGHNWATSLSCIGGGNGNPLQCSCLEYPRDGRAWWAAVYGVTQS